jgi:hypothetical protein
MAKTKLCSLWNTRHCEYNFPQSAHCRKHICLYTVPHFLLETVYRCFQSHTKRSLGFCNFGQIFSTTYSGHHQAYCGNKNGNEKEFFHSPGVGQRVLGGLGSQISWLSARKAGEYFSLTHRSPLLQGKFMVLIFWGAESTKGDMSLKNSVTKTGI